MKLKCHLSPKSFVLGTYIILARDTVELDHWDCIYPAEQNSVLLLEKLKLLLCYNLSSGS